MAQLIQSNRAVLILSDGTGTPVTLTVDCDLADFTVSGFGPGDGDHAVEAIQSRGSLCGLVEADRTFPTGSFSAYLHELTSASAGNVVDFIRRTGAYSANKSTSGHGPYTIDITFQHQNDAGDVDEWELEDCLVTLDSFTEGRPATVAFSFVCYGDHSRTHTPA